MLKQPVIHTIKRYRTLQTDRISAMPLVILMPHSACNCRCVMCDIWKDNKNLKQLTENDITPLLATFKKLGVQQVLMSGGEALLNTNFFRLCEMLQKQGIAVSLLSTGLLLKKHAEQLVHWVNDVIVSLDGDEQLHDEIRNINGAYQKLKEGVQAIKAIDPYYKVTGRTVIHKLNYKQWPAIIDAVKDIGLTQASFLPADVSSHAFNREVLWDAARQGEVVIPKEELPVLQKTIEDIITGYKDDFTSRFIAESPGKLLNIYFYYAALYGLNDFPFKKCNAPWVSAVIEADGSVKPCFFFDSFGNIKNDSFENIINSDKAVQFRRQLKMQTNDTCTKCVCSLNLPPHISLS
jgi:MoaA/NifB/PqqE/SkfB family radical SAM enzyme